MTTTKIETSLTDYPGRTLISDRMIAAYYRTQRWDEGVIKLARMGIHLEEDLLIEIGKELTEAFGLLSQARMTCYLCGRAHEPALGRLCVCFREVVVQDHYDLRDRKMIAQLPGNQVVTTSQCADCGIPVPVPAKVVQRFYQNRQHGVYRGRRYCHAHWLQRRKAKAARKREEKAALEQVQSAAQEQGKVATHIDLNGVTLPDAPRGSA